MPRKKGGMRTRRIWRKLRAATLKNLSRSRKSKRHTNNKPLPAITPITT